MLVTATLNETKIPQKQQQQAMVLETGLVQTFQSLLLRKSVSTLMLVEQKELEGRSLLKEKFPAIVFYYSVFLRILRIAKML